LQIGGTYHFEDADGGTVGTVTAATVSEEEAKMYLGVSRADGESVVLVEGMSERELQEYQEHRDAYFGVVRRAPRGLRAEFELFEFLVESHSGASREVLLERVRAAPDFDRLSMLSRDDLLLELCERQVAALIRMRST
jgi:hypothetical protein